MHPVIPAGALFGRDDEMALLAGLVKEAARGRGSSVLIEDEPGIGKSALMRAVAAAVQVRALTANRGVDAAANAVPGGAASAIEAVADGGRLATITSDPPGQRRGITVSSIYVRPDGTRLRELATRFADGQLPIPVAASDRLADAAQALVQVTGGHAAGAIVLMP